MPKIDDNPEKTKLICKSDGADINLSDEGFLKIILYIVIKININHNYILGKKENL